MAYSTSPVFRSPSYWIALAAGVVGIGAAAWQERNGSAAKVYDTPFDPSTMSDKPGSATPRQIGILMRMGALLPDGKDVHGKTMRVSMRQASGLIRSMGYISMERRRADKASSSVAYNVYLYGKLIDTVFQSGVSTVEEVKRSLIDHDGYDPAIRVTKAARSSGSGSMAKRLDADEAMFNRRFGGLVTNENGDNIQLSFNDPDDLQYYLDNHTLWTHVDGDAGTYLLPGLYRHGALGLGSRIGYYISVRPWTDADLNTVEIRAAFVAD